MTYAKTLQDQLAEFDETYQDRLQLDTDGTADGFIEVGDDIKNLLTSFAEKIAQSVREEDIEIMKGLVKQVTDSAPEGDWYLLPPNAQRVVGYLKDEVIGDIAYKGQPMNINAVFVEMVETALATLDKKAE